MIQTCSRAPTVNCSVWYKRRCSSVRPAPRSSFVLALRQPPSPYRSTLSSFSTQAVRLSYGAPLLHFFARQWTTTMFLSSSRSHLWSSWRRHQARVSQYEAVAICLVYTRAPDPRPQHADPAKLAYPGAGHHGWQRTPADRCHLQARLHQTCKNSGGFCSARTSRSVCAPARGVRPLPFPFALLSPSY